MRMHLSAQVQQGQHEARTSEDMTPVIKVFTPPS